MAVANTTAPDALNPGDDPKQTSDYANDALAGLSAAKIAHQRSAANAQQGVTDLGVAQQGAAANLRAQSGQAFNAGLQQGGGGSMAGMRQGQLSRGIAEGAQAAEFSAQRITAQRMADDANVVAGNAQTAQATGAELLHKQGEAIKGANATAISDLDSIEKSLKNNWYISHQNKIDAEKEANVKYGASTDPAVKAHLAQVIANIRAAD